MAWCRDRKLVEDASSFVGKCTIGSTWSSLAENQMAFRLLVKRGNIPESQADHWSPSKGSFTTLQDRIVPPVFSEFFNFLRCQVCRSKLIVFGGRVVFMHATERATGQLVDARALVRCFYSKDTVGCERHAIK
jgi:hypothetical protein